MGWPTGVSFLHYSNSKCVVRIGSADTHVAYDDLRTSKNGLTIITIKLTKHHDPVNSEGSRTLL